MIINNDLINTLENNIKPDINGSLTMLDLNNIVSEQCNSDISSFKLLYHFELFLRVKNIKYTRLSASNDIVFKGITITQKKDFLKEDLSFEKQQTLVTKEETPSFKWLAYLALLLVLLFIFLFYKKQNQDVFLKPIIRTINPKNDIIDNDNNQSSTTMVINSKNNIIGNKPFITKKQITYGVLIGASIYVFQKCFKYIPLKPLGQINPSNPTNVSVPQDSSEAQGASTPTNLNNTNINNRDLNTLDNALYDTTPDSSTRIGVQPSEARVVKKNLLSSFIDLARGRKE